MTPEELHTSIIDQILHQKHNRILLYSPHDGLAFEVSQDLYQRIISLAELGKWKPKAPYPSPHRAHQCPDGLSDYPHWPLTEREKLHQRSMRMAALQPKDYFIGDGRVMLKPALRSLAQTLGRQLTELPPQRPDDCQVALLWGFDVDQPMVFMYIASENPPGDQVGDASRYCLILDNERVVVRSMIDFLEKVDVAVIYDRAMFDIELGCKP